MIRLNQATHNKSFWNYWILQKQALQVNLFFIIITNVNYFTVPVDVGDIFDKFRDMRAKMLEAVEDTGISPKRPRSDKKGMGLGLVFVLLPD